MIKISRKLLEELLENAKEVNNTLAIKVPRESQLRITQENLILEVSELLRSEYPYE